MTVNLYIFTEELSAEKCFENLLIKFFPKENYQKQFQIISYSGNADLEKNCLKTIKTISSQKDARVLLTIDQDQKDCKALKKKFEKILQKNCGCPFKIRIVCRELESWFLGDLKAVEKAYLGFKANKFKNDLEIKNGVDQIKNPSHKLFSMLPNYPFRELKKVENARRVSANFGSKNTSISFNQAIQAIQNLITN